MTPPRKFSALPPRVCTEASPKAISRRTSYLRVRLEFLPYPHLIATLFNGCAFGPPLPLTAASAWTWVDHPVSGLLRLTVALLRPGFPSAPRLWRLTLPDGVTRRTVLQKVRGYTHKVLPQFVSTGFQVLFHSPPGVLFTIPSQYYALSVTKQYLALGGGPPDFPQGSTCLVVLWIPPCPPWFPVRGFHPLWPAFPKPFRYHVRISCAVRNPGMHASRFRLLRVRSPLLAESNFSFFSSGYLDVSVPRVPLHTLWIGVWIHEGHSCGLPHSEICGSMGMCPSPQLIAACHVFHRLLVPRHPPCALFA